MSGIKARHTPALGELSLPKHDVTEGFLTLALARSKHLALICLSLDCNIGYVSGSTLSQHGLVSDMPESNY